MIRKGKRYASGTDISKQIRFIYGEYTFRDPGEVVDLDQMVSQLVNLELASAIVKQPS